MIAATPKDFYAANFNPVGGEDVGSFDAHFARASDGRILCRHLHQNFRKITRDCG